VTLTKEGNNVGALMHEPEDRRWFSEKVLVKINNSEKSVKPSSPVLDMNMPITPWKLSILRNCCQSP